MKKIIKLSSLLVIAFALVVLAGCAPKSVDAAKEKMTDAGYIAVGYQGEGEGLVGAFSATKIISITKAESIVATLYDSKSAAKEAYKKASENLKADELCEQIGKWIVVGTEEAIKAFK